MANVTEIRAGDGSLITTRLECEVSGRTHEELHEAAHQQAKALFGERPYVIEQLDVKPGVEQYGAEGATVALYFASVTARSAA